MLLQPKVNPFDSTNHIFEWKVDGVRCIAFYDNNKIRLQSRSGKDCTRQFPELWSLMLDAKEAILDGEITVFTNGKPDFEAVMERYLSGTTKVNLLLENKPAYYVVWDILWLDGNPTTGLPLIERKGLLDRVLGNSDHIKKMEWIDAEGFALWAAITVQGLEGMVAKKKDTPYICGKRSAAWIKVKNYHQVEVNAFGYKKKNGAILVGTENKVQGHAIGMRPADKAVLWALLDKYGSEKNGVIWLPLDIRGRVQFTTYTSRGNMRDCSWVGFVV